METLGAGKLQPCTGSTTKPTFEVMSPKSRRMRRSSKNQVGRNLRLWGHAVQGSRGIPQVGSRVECRGQMYAAL